MCVSDETDANNVMSTNLEIIIDNLEKYTNYSIQVLAFTRKGEGVRSSPLYVQTMEDGRLSSCVDQEGRDRGSRPWPLESHKAIRFLSNTDTDPLESHNAIKPILNVGPSSASQQNAI